MRGEGGGSGAPAPPPSAGAIPGLPGPQRAAPPCSHAAAAPPRLELGRDLAGELDLQPGPIAQKEYRFSRELSNSSIAAEQGNPHTPPHSAHRSAPPPPHTKQLPSFPFFPLVSAAHSQWRG